MSLSWEELEDRPVEDPRVFILLGGLRDHGRSLRVTALKWLLASKFFRGDHLPLF